MTAARLFSLIGRILAALALVVVLYIAVGGVMTAAAGAFPRRGEMIDIGRRRLRLVCAGPKDSTRPVVILEAGAFGFAADFGTVQDRLAEQGLRSCAYDRAGLGFSDPGPEPRDGIAIASDLEALLSAAKIAPPYVMVGHSMGGLRLRQFAGRHPDQVVGVVLVDATAPEDMDNHDVRRFVGQFISVTRWAGVGASLGLFGPLAGTGMANKIGLTGEAEREKRHAFASGQHNRTAAQEVVLWPTSAEEAARTPPYAPDLPVAVVTAGALTPANAARKAMQAALAQASRHGAIDHVAGANHTTLLGPLYADHVVKGVQFVMAAAGR